MNRLFVANKPAYIGSNWYLGRLKRKYGVKKAGFSGTLDPFASGTLVIAFGQYTKLFRFLNKVPKTYRATLWLGAKSASLDIENFEGVTECEEVSQKEISDVLNSVLGEITYTPPSFSAKKINGKRAYDLAREGKDVELKKSIMNIYDTKLIHYRHPFITFEATVSEGTYIRSLAQMIAEKLNSFGTLSALHRKNEGLFNFENEIALNPIKYLNTKENRYLSDIENIRLGKKLSVEDFDIKEPNTYHIVNGKYLTIFTINQELKIKYEINNLEL